MKTFGIIGFAGLMFLVSSCSRDAALSDAYGNFESTEVSVSPEVPGKIIRLGAEEGQALKSGDTVGLIDTTELHLKLMAALEQRKAIVARGRSIDAQLAVSSQQADNLKVEKRRVEALLKDKAATPKQLDDIDAGLRLNEKQSAAIRVQREGIDAELGNIDKLCAQLRESISRCIIINPTEGTVLNRYSEAGEVAVVGRPLYKIADLKTMYLRVYVSGKQLPGIRLGQEATVLVDTEGKTRRSIGGNVSWISSSAEFSPKIIQTMEDRVNLVYAVKVRVANDGSLKINMPGEVNFR